MLRRGNAGNCQCQKNRQLIPAPAPILRNGIGVDELDHHGAEIFVRGGDRTEHLCTRSVGVPRPAEDVPILFLDADLLANGVIEAIEPYLKDGECIWIDTFCHNQHNIGSVVPQMERVIAEKLGHCP